MLPFNEFKKKLSYKVPKKFTARYYGTRDLEIFPKLFLDYVDECPSFIDVTAGGGRFIYDQAFKGKTVGANDRCYYSYLALRSVLQLGDPARSDWFEQLWYNTLPQEYDSGTHGYFAASDYQPFVSYPLRRYIDELCLAYKNNPLVLYAAGKAIRGIFTFRGLGWCPETPFGILSEDVTSEYFHKVFMKAVWTTSLYGNQILQLQKKHEVCNLDALEAIKTGFSDYLIAGSMVYADPAWPWEKSSGNPYTWFTNDLSSILAQRKIQIEYWPRDAGVILEDVCSWAKAAFERNVRYFVICGQDTNFPPLKDIRAYINQRFNLVKWIEVQDQSKAAHRKYTTAWGIFEQ